MGVVVSKEARRAQVEGEPVLEARGHVEQRPLPRVAGAGAGAGQDRQRRVM